MWCKVDANLVIRETAYAKNAPTWHSRAESLNGQQFVNRIFFFSNRDPATWAAQESFVFMWMMVAGLVQCYLAGQHRHLGQLIRMSIPKKKSDEFFAASARAWPGRCMWCGQLQKRSARFQTTLCTLAFTV